MAESDVATAPPPEISPADNQAQESTPSSEVAAPKEEVEKEVKETHEEGAEKEVNETQEEEVEKEVKETQEVEKTKVEMEDAAAGVEAVPENQDLKRKLEVQEETERQVEGADNGEGGNAGGEEREGNDTKRQKTETAEAERSEEACEEEPAVPDNVEHDINNNYEKTAEGDVQKDEFITEKTETEDGSSDVSRTIEVPNHRVGVLIGKAGDTIRNMQKLSGARIQIVKDSEAAPDSTTRIVELLGSVESIDKAEELIRDVLAEADAGRPPPLYGRGFNSSQSSTTEIEMQVPNEKVGSIIGKGGQMIKDLQARSGAHILLVPTDSAEGEDVKERTVRLSGNKQQVEAAKYMIKDVINQMKRRHVFYLPKKGVNEAVYGAIF